VIEVQDTSTNMNADESLTKSALGKGAPFTNLLWIGRMTLRLGFAEGGVVRECGVIFDN
jgi:hypothetical protein